MSTNTTNYDLVKPDATDFYDVKVMNENLDKIDTAIKQAKDAASEIDLSEIEQNIATISQAIKTVEKTVTQHLAQDATLTEKGHVQLSSATNSDDETKAATPKAVKIAHDLANSKQDTLPIEQKRNIFISTTAPTSPSDGDIWIEV